MSSGFDLIESTFESCDVDDDDQLNEDEIHQENCMETLEAMFGITERWLNMISQKIDTNADRKISFKEAQMAYEKSQGFNRSKKENK